MSVEVIHGDCLEVLATLEPDSFDACCTDPPYGLGFMSRHWDAPDNVAFQPETWAAVYRVLKPGAHLLAFGSTRRYHRLACAIEDAGFEIRDCVLWLTGQGFPKSLNVAKAIQAGSGRPEDIRRLAMGWNGWGTALKPACEPIVVARKPLSEGTVAANVLRWGTGAINVDASRVAVADGEPNRRDNASVDRHGGIGGNGTYHGGNQTSRAPTLQTARWPANVCHDGSPEVLAAFAKFGERTSGEKNGGGYARKNGCHDGGQRLDGTSCFADAGSAARFFYCSKADASERVGTHPTVKPVALMEWLVRMVTPPGGRVLDPFCGTGSTLVACDSLGFDAIGIEQDAQTVADAREKIIRMRARRLLGDDIKPVEHAPGQLEMML